MREVLVIDWVDLKGRPRETHVPAATGRDGAVLRVREVFGMELARVVGYREVVG